MTQSKHILKRFLKLIVVLKVYTDTYKIPHSEFKTLQTCPILKSAKK